MYPNACNPQSELILGGVYVFNREFEGNTQVFLIMIIVNGEFNGFGSMTNSGGYGFSKNSTVVTQGFDRHFVFHMFITTSYCDPVHVLYLIWNQPDQMLSYVLVGYQM
jgi:hypothetical protein